MEKITKINVFTDGGARGNPGPGAIGVYITDEKRRKIFGFGKKLGVATNNVAEYTAVLEALQWIYQNRKQFGQNLQISFFLDSKLVCSQLLGLFKIKSLHLAQLLLAVKKKEKLLNAEISYAYIPREQNKEADRFVNQALDNLL